MFRFEKAILFCNICENFIGNASLVLNTQSILQHHVLFSPFPVCSVILSALLRSPDLTPNWLLPITWNQRFEHPGSDQVSPGMSPTWQLPQRTTPLEDSTHRGQLAPWQTTQVDSSHGGQLPWMTTPQGTTSQRTTSQRTTPLRITPQRTNPPKSNGYSDWKLCWTMQGSCPLGELSSGELSSGKLSSGELS